jgi:hypothetical protein
VTVDDHDRVVKWLKTGYGYFVDFGLPSMQEHDRQEAQKFLDRALPLLARLDKVNREMRIPALADGQIALVIDGKLSSNQFIAALPATEKPMPMAEPALVRGVSDAKLLKQALTEYRSIANGLIDAARQIDEPNFHVPEGFQIPPAQVTEGPSSTIYSFPLPKEWGVDEKIVPNLGLSNDVVVISASKDQTQRLLKATPLATGGVLAKTDRPLAAALCFNWTALVDAATPWIDYAIGQAAVARGVDETQQKEMAQQVHTGLDVLKALRSISSESYLEDDVMVNHTLMEIHDVER